MKYHAKPLTVEAHYFNGDIAEAITWSKEHKVSERCYLYMRCFGVVPTRGELVLRDEFMRTDTRVPVGTYLVIFPNGELLIILKEQFENNYVPYKDLFQPIVRLGYFDGE